VPTGLGHPTRLSPSKPGRGAQLPEALPGIRGFVPLSTGPVTRSLDLSRFLSLLPSNDRAGATGHVLRAGPFGGGQWWPQASLTSDGLDADRSVASVGFDGEPLVPLGLDGGSQPVTSWTCDAREVHLSLAAFRAMRYEAAVQLATSCMHEEAAFGRLSVDPGPPAGVGRAFTVSDNRWNRDAPILKCGADNGGDRATERKNSMSNLVDDFQEWQRRASEAQGKAAHAYARLLSLAERGDSGQVRRIAQFLAGTYDGKAFPFDLFELRMVDVTISDDMLACLDALRWGRIDLYKLVPDGERRVQAVIDSWGLKRPGAT
jgi:hypothetical protein